MAAERRKLAAGKQWHVNQVVFSPDFARDRRAYLMAVRKIRSSTDAGATWQNLGAIPNGAAALATSTAADTLWAGNRGIWEFAAGPAPTATPNPLQDLLANRSFEYEAAWRIPDTAYDAAYSQEQHFAGAWSMRTGIADPADNVRSYSDFSQDVTLPRSSTVTLRLQRWTQAGAGELAVEAGANSIVLRLEGVGPQQPTPVPTPTPIQGPTPEAQMWLPFVETNGG
jgi:hypothetical protein